LYQIFGEGIENNHLFQMDFDPYEVLGLDINASEKDIKRAYRKISRTCHPDKNPSPEATEKFILIGRARDFLVDEEQRGKYDQEIKSTRKREAHESERKKKMSETRRKFEESLKQRMKEEEEGSSRALKKQRNDLNSSTSTMDLREIRLQNEIVREREERKFAERAQELFESVRGGKSVEVGLDDMLPNEVKIKIKWRRGDTYHQPYSEEELFSMFSAFGAISEMKSDASKPNVVFIHFTSPSSALQAIKRYIHSSNISVRWGKGGETNPELMEFVGKQRRKRERKRMKRKERRSKTNKRKKKKKKRKRGNSSSSSFDSTTSASSISSSEDEEERKIESGGITSYHHLQENQSQRQDGGHGEKLGTHPLFVSEFLESSLSFLELEKKWIENCKI